MKEDQWAPVAKVIICCFKQEKQFPAQLFEDFIQRCLNAKKVDNEQLMETFISSLPPLDKDTVSMALIDFDNVDENDMGFLLKL